MNFYQHSTEQINQLATALEDPDLDMKGLGWKAAFHLRELQALILDLEAQLCAIGAGGVGASIQPPVQADTAAPAQPPAAHQEPVAWRVHPFDYGVGSKGVYALTQMPKQVEMWKRKGWKVEPLYTAPQPTENLRCKSTQKRLATLWGYVKQEPARQPLPADTYIALAHRIATRFTYSTDRSFCEYYFAIHTLEQFVRAIEQAHGITGGQQ